MTTHQPVGLHINQWGSTSTSGAPHQLVGLHINQWGSTSTSGGPHNTRPSLNGNVVCYCTHIFTKYDTMLR